MTTTETTTPFYYCPLCETATLHKDGRCVECEHELHREKVAWMRTKRKLITIGVVVPLMFGIAWLTAQHFSGDDVLKATMMSVVGALGVWLGTSLKAESQVNGGLEAEARELTAELKKNVDGIRDDGASHAKS